MAKKQILNIGEVDELLCKINLIHIRDNKEEIPNIGKFFSVGLETEYKRNTYSKIQIESLFEKIKSKANEEAKKELKSYCEGLNINKSPSYSKADVIINKVGYSIKSKRGAKAAIMNHTHRSGILKVCKRVGLDIEILDKYIVAYWSLLDKGIFKEDMKNDNELSAFYNGYDDLCDLINYFLFKGTPTSDSKYPSEFVLLIDNPLDKKSYKVYSREKYLKLVWHDLVFSLRSRSYIENEINNVWCKRRANKKKGTLHIRV